MHSTANDQASATAPLDYAPAWRRFVALLWDGVIVSQLCAPWSFGWALSSVGTVAAYAAICVTRAAYDPIMHGRWGWTVGKRAVGIELRTVAGDRIGWRHALLRSSVDLFFHIANLVLVLIAWRQGGSPLPERIDPAEVGKLLVPTSDVLYWTAVVWYVGELVTMFANDERRALHDVIGGTVVIRIDAQQT